MTHYRILIVEDEILIAESIKRHLTKEGHEVVGIAISYEEAKLLYLQERPDLCLLDIQLSGTKTGIDFAHFIQSQEQPQPFIYLTSQLDGRSIASAKETFPAGYLAKSVQKESLFATIQVVMHCFAAQREGEDSISFQDCTTSHRLTIKDVLYLQAEHVYVKIYLTRGRQVLVRNSIKNILTKCPSTQFLQTHRSYIVNTQHISRWDKQSIYIEDVCIPISRARRISTLLQLRAA